MFIVILLLLLFLLLLAFAIYWFFIRKTQTPQPSGNTNTWTTQNKVDFNYAIMFVVTNSAPNVNVGNDQLNSITNTFIKKYTYDQSVFLIDLFNTLNNKDANNKPTILFTNDKLIMFQDFIVLVGNNIPELNWNKIPHDYLVVQKILPPDYDLDCAINIISKKYTYLQFAFYNVFMTFFYQGNNLLPIFKDFVDFLSTANIDGLCKINLS